jgi:hypothetical protein
MILINKKRIKKARSYIRDGPLEKWRGGGGGKTKKKIYPEQKSKKKKSSQA